jgi:hypothetical protein
MFAEYLLRILVRRERAEAIVGDLMETYGTPATASFWFAWLRVMVRLGWRPTVALFVAAVVCLISDFALTTVTARRFAFGTSRNLPLLFRSFFFAEQSASFGALAAFAFFRYGLRDRSSWLSALYAGVCTLYVYTFLMPSLRIEFYICCAVVALISLSSGMQRGAALVVAASLVSWIAASRILGFLFYLLFTLTTTRRHLIGNVWISGVVSRAVPLVLAALTFGLLHRRLMEADPSQASLRGTQSIP